MHSCKSCITNSTLGVFTPLQFDTEEFVLIVVMAARITSSLSPDEGLEAVELELVAVGTKEGTLLLIEDMFAEIFIDWSFPIEQFVVLPITSHVILPRHGHFSQTCVYEISYDITNRSHR